MGNKQSTFDFKKEYKEFYLPPKKPGILTVPEMHYVSVCGKGNPNEPEGEYKAAIGILYAIAFTIRMSEKSGQKIDGYFPYVVPPLEGLWQQAGGGGIDYSRKEDFEWRAMIRLSEFVTEEVFDWAVCEASEKKQKDFSKAEFFIYREGLCVQCMHIGSYDEEPATIQKMRTFLDENGYAEDFSGARLHHEIYLSDPRRTAEERLRTVLRQPVKRKES